MHKYAMHTISIKSTTLKINYNWCTMCKQHCACVHCELFYWYNCDADDGSGSVCSSIYA